LKLAGDVYDRCADRFISTRFNDCVVMLGANQRLVRSPKACADRDALCAAAGTCCGIVPASVLDTVYALREVERHKLPKSIANNTTHLVWAGEAAPKLQRFVDLLPVSGE
jgi:DNA-binding transcriptional LysR family regulator